MRILIHTDEYSPTCRACAYRMQVFAQVLQAHGNQVTVITSSTNQRISPGGGQERVIYAPAFPLRRKTAFNRMLNNLSFSLTSVFAALWAGKADVVLTTSPPALLGPAGWLIAKLKRATLVYDVRDIWPDVAVEMGKLAPDGLYSKIFRGIADFMYCHADLITTVSPGKVRKLRHRLRQLKRSHEARVLLVENGFDETILDQTSDPALAAQYGLTDTFTCVYIGNVGLAQGLDLLLDLAKTPTGQKARFLIFGDGAQASQLARRIDEEGIGNVRLCGVLPHDRVATVLRHAKLSFIPLKSPQMKDSIPTKLYESLGLGCPVLLAAEGDAAHVLASSGLGRCVSPDHPELLADTFARMQEDYPQLISRREEAMELVRTRYSRQRAAQKLAEYLR